MSSARQPGMRLKGVTRQYRGPPIVNALRDATFEVGLGEFIALVGRSGSGKSTLLNVLGLLDRPSSGDYWIFDKRVSDLSDRERSYLRAGVFGFVFQDAHILGERTVTDNVNLKLISIHYPRRDRAAAVAQAIDSVGLSHRAGALGRDLSGGERQRVAFARALVGGPNIVLADEPTGNLDRVTAESILELAKDLHSDGLTVVVITHDDDVAAAADRVVEIVDGVVCDTLDQ